MFVSLDLKGVNILDDEGAREFSRCRGLQVDVDKYNHLLGNENIPEDKKEEFMLALWSVISAFIELGYGVHPVQLSQRPKTDQCAASFYGSREPQDITEPERIS